MTEVQEPWVSKVHIPVQAAHTHFLDPLRNSEKNYCLKEITSSTFFLMFFVRNLSSVL